jgi:hypothetical protein
VLAEPSAWTCKFNAARPQVAGAAPLAGLVADALAVAEMVGMAGDVRAVAGMVGADADVQAEAGTDAGAQALPGLGAEAPPDVAVVRLVLAGWDALAVAAGQLAAVGVVEGLQLDVSPMDVAGGVAKQGNPFSRVSGRERGSGRDAREYSHANSVARRRRPPTVQGSPGGTSTFSHELFRNPGLHHVHQRSRVHRSHRVSGRRCTFIRCRQCSGAPCTEPAYIRAAPGRP